MTTSKQMEPNVNNALGNLLKSMMPTCTVLETRTETPILPKSSFP